MAAGNAYASLLSNKVKGKQKNPVDYKGVVDTFDKQRESVLKTPDQDSLDAEMWDKIGDANPDAKGIFAVMSRNAKGKSLDKGKGEMLQYLMQAGQQAAKLNEQHAREQHAKEIAVPLMEKYNQIAPNLTPEQRVDAANQIRARLSGVLGQELPPVIDTGGSKFENWVTQDPETGDVKYFDLLAALNPRGDNDLNSLERMAIQQQEFNNTLAMGQMNVDQQRVNAYNKDIENRWNPQSHFDVSAGKTQGAEGNKMALKLQESNLELEDVAYDIDFLKDLLKDGQVITGDTLKAKNARLWAGMGGTQALSDSELYDATAKSLLKFANNSASFGNANQKEFEFLKAPVPDSHKTKAANERLLERFADKLKKQMSRNEKVISQYQSFNPYQEQQGQEQPSGAQTPPDAGQKAGEGSVTGNISYTKMQKPDGTPVAVSVDKVYEKMLEGYKPIK